MQAIIGFALAQQFTNSDFDFSRIVNAGLVDVGLIVAFASWLRWGRSRFAALLLLLMALLSFGAKTAGSGINIWLVSLIVFGAACKAVEATFKLPKYENAPAQEEHQQVTAADMAFDDIAGAEAKAADLRGRDVDVIGLRQVVRIR